MPLSAPYPTQARFRAGYGVINYILTASLCSFDFSVIKSAIEVSDPRKCGSQVGEGGGALAVPDSSRHGENKDDDLCDGLLVRFTLISSKGLLLVLIGLELKVHRHWRMTLLKLIFY